MPKVKKIPLRQCIACRELKEKKVMLRVVKTAEGKVFLDFSGKASGRGAYICDNPSCITKLKKSRLLDKVFSCRIDDGIYAAIEEEYFGRKG
ncbi:MAG: YlxR family protein [Clostridia bacterium]|nr:YlxR family protein [Clostridia bacterium]